MSHTYNAQHSPMGAFASFTLGYPGRSGGFGSEIGKPSDQDIWIGLEAADGTHYEALPFFDGHDTISEAARYDVGNATADNSLKPVQAFPQNAVQRTFSLGTDTWTAGDLTFRIYSPTGPIPDPRTDDEAARQALLPGVFAEIIIDNTRNDRSRRGFFGFASNDAADALRTLEWERCSVSYAGVAQGARYGIAARQETPYQDKPYNPILPVQGFDIALALNPDNQANRRCGLGGVAALTWDVPAHARRTVRCALAFHKDGQATTGLDTRYLYNRWYSTLESVFEAGLAALGKSMHAALANDRWLAAQQLSPERTWMLAQAIRGYYNSTELLEHDGQPLWVVNEGEYRMMNTFDLTVDQLFYELEFNPWTVRCVLDLYLQRYSYHDETHFPNDTRTYPGGIAFTHDMGVANQFTPPGRSCYEQQGISGCFSHMTCEQLTNWVLCAVLYAEKTHDRAWLAAHRDTFALCMTSLLYRDHPEAGQRNGVMGLDSSRTLDGKKVGAEITTYDSLDASLGQSRSNTYLAGKCWAAYHALYRAFTALAWEEMAESTQQAALRCAATLAAALQADGIPALLEGSEAWIIPTVEGLVYALYGGWQEALAQDGIYAALLHAWEQHMHIVLKEGVCKFANGAWKLSSTSDNTWLSKVYLCQYVVERAFGLPQDHTADAQHMAWLQDNCNAYWCWSDQMVAGVAQGSRYYPRGVTAILWTLTGT